MFEKSFFSFTLFQVFFSLMFGLMFILIMTAIIKQFKEKKYNDKEPKMNTKARVVAKRTSVQSASTSCDSEGVYHTSPAYTYYYATFQFETGDRSELQVQGNEFATLVVGDSGMLLFQGKKFLTFTREQ